MSKVIAIESEAILFEDGFKLESYHDQDCCESHYLSTDDLSISDFDWLEFDLSGDFFKKIVDYGIELIPIKGHSVKIPGYGSNNGYSSSDLSLILSKNGEKIATYDISECQNINWD